ncbi:hypothetical protein FNV43_RR21151 [Rhamnella rubrinervis]|uniref:NAB domain-containing protein n=1 Tax=Rhamnella rubrinervis TaxID=2594499 RepID=A0A8K0E254_9ROSA|nr:hypothetical protein FNV43_RR21151 [Rhamnella rubrinervis]
MKTNMKMEMERAPIMGSIESGPSPSPSSRRSFSSRNSNLNSSIPVWLLSNLADMEERMKTLEINKSETETMGDTFAERAESYYRKRPQLLALLQDLYNAYVNLTDRYKQVITKVHHRRVSSIENDYQCQHEEGDGISSEIESEVESSLSYQQPPSMQMTEDDCGIVDGDGLFVELVMKDVEFNILMHEVTKMDQRCCESSRKIELQKSLLDVLESERLILLNENARLEYRVATLVEENKGLVSETLFMKRKAGELARCVLRMREDQRVCMLSNKIEDLQGQIYKLEKRNKECYEQAMKKEKQLGNDEANKSSDKLKKNENVVDLETCFQTDKLNKKLMGIENHGNGNGKRVGIRKNGGIWWKRVKNMELYPQPPLTLLQYHLLPLKLSKDEIVSLLHGHPLIVTALPGTQYVTLNEIRVAEWNVYNDGRMIIHGVEDFFDPAFQTLRYPSYGVEEIQEKVDLANWCIPSQRLTAGPSHRLLKVRALQLEFDNVKLKDQLL